jgi:hypothetical protein
MNETTKRKIIALQQKGLDLRERARRVLELEEILLEQGHINAKFKELLEYLREFLKTGNGQYASVTEKILDEITEYLIKLLDGAQDDSK